MFTLPVLTAGLARLEHIADSTKSVPALVIMGKVLSVSVVSSGIAGGIASALGVSSGVIVIVAAAVFIGLGLIAFGLSKSLESKEITQVEPQKAPCTSLDAITAAFSAISEEIVPWEWQAKTLRPLEAECVRLLKEINSRLAQQKDILLEMLRIDDCQEQIAEFQRLEGEILVFQEKLRENERAISHTKDLVRGKEWPVLEPNCEYPCLQDENRRLTLMVDSYRSHAVSCGHVLSTGNSLSSSNSSKDGFEDVVIN